VNQPSNNNKKLTDYGISEGCDIVILEGFDYMASS